MLLINTEKPYFRINFNNSKLINVSLFVCLRSKERDFQLLVESKEINDQVESMLLVLFFQL